LLKLKGHIGEYDEIFMKYFVDHCVVFRLPPNQLQILTAPITNNSNSQLWDGTLLAI